MDEPISEAVRQVLDYMREQHKGAVIPSGMASLVFCGVEDVEISELSDHELMQLAIYQYCQLVSEQSAMLRLLQAVKSPGPRPNRFTRRHR